MMGTLDEWQCFTEGEVTLSLSGLEIASQRAFLPRESFPSMSAVHLAGGSSWEHLKLLQELVSYLVRHIHRPPPLPYIEEQLRWPSSDARKCLS